MLEIWIPLLILLFGLTVGSFLNVCIYRIPLSDVSIHSPRRSFCPECNETIKVHDNIPVLSYLILWGKCRYCKARISVIYPLVELATGALFLHMFYHFGLTLEFLLALVFIAVLLPISLIDARYYIIPNVIIATGLVLGMVVVCAIAYQRADVWYLLTRIIGAVAGGMALWLIAVIGSAILRKKAMGGGDIKLMALIGLFLGAWPQLVMVIAFSALSGAIVGSALILSGRKSRQSPIPYGPFLAGAAVLVLLWGDELWQIYLRFVGWN
ncbi:prepilin peptidase [Candidatus Poribacteria bacterium]|nr:MAG: prepilin peptidase [Candidatus Poribacteria bacterium]